ncbi:MAG TPA: aromatic-ring-hydroxylating dioxygenase subunit beta [Pseudomonadales bacterium]
MSGFQPVMDVAVISKIEQFYFREARLLDDRQYQQWLLLLAEDIQYTVPTRHTPWLNTALRDTEAVLNVEQELSQAHEVPLRDDNYLTLMIRVTRSFKLSAWADNPPARTRRLVSNVEVLSNGMGEYKTYSNTLLSFSRHQHDNVLYSYQREDILMPQDDGFKIKNRNVLLDWNVITGPSVGLLF